MRFRFVIVVLALLGELPFFFLARGLLEARVAHAAMIVAAMCAALTWPLVVRLRRGMADSAEQGWIAPFLVVFYAFWGASLTAGVAWPALRALTAAAGWAPQIASIAALAVGALEGALGVSWQRLHPRMRRHDVTIAGLPRALDGYTIAQLSDLHIGAHTPPERLAGWVDRVNQLDVDLIAVTGDLITSGPSFVAATARELGRLRARDGVALCMGNHDYFCDAEVLVAALEKEGIDVLRNRGKTVGAGDRRYFLCGVDDTWQRRDDPARAMAEHPPELTAIALAHDPKCFAPLARLGAGLVLSGHTHGGQIAVPLFARTLNVARIAYRHTAGLYRDRLEGRAQLFVSRGAGTTGPPLRIGAPAEIPILVLRAA